MMDINELLKYKQMLKESHRDILNNISYVDPTLKNDILQNTNEIVINILNLIEKEIKKHE